MLLAAVSLTMLLVAAAISWFYLPRATIELRAAMTTKKVTQNISLSQSLSDPDFVHFGLPAQTINKTVEERKQIKRAGGKVSEEAAHGMVKLINDQDEEQPLLPQTNLRHEQAGVFFLTDNPVRIPARGSMTVNVTAKEIGASGNVPAGKFIVDKLPASLQQVVYGKSDTAFSGGEVSDSPITEEELAGVKQELQDSAQKRIQGEMTADAGGAVIRPDLMRSQIEDWQTSVTAGSRASSYEAFLRLKGQAFIVDDNALLGLMLLALRAAPKADEEFVAYDPESFQIKFLRADFDRGEAQVQGQLEGTFTQKTESAIFSKENLAGLGDAEVKEYFSKFSSIKDVQVKFWPFWVKAVPSSAKAVNIVMDTADGEQK